MVMHTAISVSAGTTVLGQGFVLQATDGCVTPRYPFGSITQAHGPLNYGPQGRIPHEDHLELELADVKKIVAAAEAEALKTSGP